MKACMGIKLDSNDHCNNLSIFSALCLFAHMKYSIIGTIVHPELTKKKLSTKGSSTENIDRFDFHKEQKSQ